MCSSIPQHPARLPAGGCHRSRAAVCPRLPCADRIRREEVQARQAVQGVGAAVDFRQASTKVLGKGNELTPYQLRHTFAQVATEHVPRDVHSRMLGHSDEGTALFYYEVRDNRAVSAAKTLKLHPAKAG